MAANLWDLHLSADAITKRLTDMTDAELAALEQRMICRRTDCAGGHRGSVGQCRRSYRTGDAEGLAAEDALAFEGRGFHSGFARGLTQCLTALQYSTHYGPSLS